MIALTWSVDIEKRNLLPPLMVIQTLARNSTCTLAVVKDYVSRCLQKENEQIAEVGVLCIMSVFGCCHGNGLLQCLEFQSVSCSCVH